MQYLHKIGVPGDHTIYLINCDEMRLQRTLIFFDIKDKSNIIAFEEVNRMNINIIFHSKVWGGNDYGTKNKLIYYKNSVMSKKFSQLPAYLLGSEKFVYEFFKHKQKNRNLIIFRNSNLYNYFKIKIKKKEYFVKIDVEDNNKFKLIDLQADIFETQEVAEVRDKLNKHYNQQNSYLNELLRSVK